MTFYCGIDLHSKKSHVCIIDKNGKKVEEENLNNDLSLILQFLKPFGKDVHVAIGKSLQIEDYYEILTMKARLLMQY